MRKVLLLILLGLSPFVYAKDIETFSYNKKFANIAVNPGDINALSKIAEADVIMSEFLFCGTLSPKFEKMDVLESSYGSKFGLYTHTLKIYYSCFQN